MNDENSFRTFGDFYPFYLGEHANRTCRRLHFTGTSIAFALLITAGSLWVVYGAASGDWPVVATNTGMILLNVALLAAKLRYR